MISIKNNLVQVGHNSGKSEARVLNLLAHDLSDNKKHTFEVP
jgi:hypothetical protein